MGAGVNTGREHPDMECPRIDSTDLDDLRLLATSHEISHAPETYASPPTRVLLP
jgi:hypothetical protein